MIPVALTGTRGALGRIRMIIGAPIVSRESGKVSKADLEKASDLVMDRIASMMKKQ